MSNRKFAARASLAAVLLLGVCNATPAGDEPAPAEALAPALPPASQDPTNAPHYIVACDPTIPGKLVEGACFDYAIRLRTELCLRADRPADMLFFQWFDPALTGERAAGAHVIVLWYDEHGDLWGTDNQQPKPLRLPGDEPLEWARAFAKPGLTIELVGPRLDEYLPPGEVEAGE